MWLNVLLIYLVIGFVFTCIPVIQDGGLEQVGKVAPSLSFQASVAVYFVVGTLIAPALLLIDMVVVGIRKIRGK